MADDIEELRDLLRQRQVLVVVGAGVTIQATGNAPCASWQGLLRHGAEHAGKYDRAFRDKRLAIVRDEIESGLMLGG